MESTIDMQNMRHLNLFSKITKIDTRFCFVYNQTIIFCVPKHLVSRAIGEGGKNSKELNKILGKKVKIIPAPNGIQDAKQFIQSIVDPIEFKDLDVKEEEIVIHAGKNKAALIGREKRRLIEMKKIIKNFFGRDIRIA